MPRKLKVYQTSQGFFDLAIAVPSMKAALEAWGANGNLFHQGFAKEVTDSNTVEAAMAKPGVVLKRPVGTHRAFSENAQLPRGRDLDNRPSRSKAPAATSARKSDDKKAKAATLADERAEGKREAKRRNRAAAEAKDRKRREKAIEKAQAAYDKAEQEHEAHAGALEAKRADLEEREKVEDSRWEGERERLRNAIRKASGW